MNVAAYVWLALLVVFIITEAMTAQLVSSWFIIGSLVAGLAAVLGAPVWLQILLFVVVSALALVLFRPLLKKRITPKITPTNADRSIGKVAIIKEAVDNERGEGRATVDGVDWMARSYYGDTLSKGSRCVIYAIDGAKLIVGPIKEEV